MSADRQTELEFNATLQHLDELVQEFEHLPLPKVRAKAMEMLATIDAVHREGLSRLIAFIREQGHADLVLRAAHDPIVHALLLLYDFLPDDETPGFIPFDQLATLPPRERRRPVFSPIARAQDIALGTYRVYDIDNARVFIANVNGDIYAVRNNCPGSAAPLNLGPFTPPIIVCPWHNEAWDIRTGKRSDGQAGPNLQVLPVAIVDGVIQLAINTTRANSTPGVG
ncbi:MAG: Rieske (2Fe-2S) protein [Chloroflexi bacterium]|nr:Rieske (2Fe-2S) protein [Chloroflexota bacterium]